MRRHANCSMELTLQVARERVLWRYYLESSYVSQMNLIAPIASLCTYPEAIRKYSSRCCTHHRPVHYDLALRYSACCEDAYNWWVRHTARLLLRTFSTNCFIGHRRWYLNLSYTQSTADFWSCEYPIPYGTCTVLTHYTFGSIVQFIQFITVSRSTLVSYFYMLVEWHNSVCTTVARYPYDRGYVPSPRTIVYR